MTNEAGNPDPIEILRRSDPASTHRPSLAQEARLRARIEEVIAMDQIDPGNRRPLWQRPAVRGLATAALAAAVVFAAVMVRPSEPRTGESAPTVPPASNAAVAPSPTTSPPIAPSFTAAPTSSSGTGPISPGGGMASCVELYDLETLAQREFAFDGTVTAINGEEATFTLNTVFRGSAGSTVTLVATGMTGGAITSAGDVQLTLGGRYLVAGEEHFAWACGFTQPYDPSVAADWAAALK